MAIRDMQQLKRLGRYGAAIGLEPGEETADYFCTPVGAAVLGWDNGIHYCVLEQFGDMVFCVNPESCGEQYVYPLASSTEDFLRLLLATKHTNVMQQILWWDRAQYEAFLRAPDTVAYNASPAVVEALSLLRDEWGIVPMEDPFGYIKALQASFPYEKIPFSRAYYDTLGLALPDGTQPEEPAEAAEAVAFCIEKQETR